MSLFDNGVDHVAVTPHRLWLDPYSLDAHHSGIAAPITVGLSHCQAPPPTLLSSNRNERRYRHALAHRRGTSGSYGYGSRVYRVAP